MVRYLKQLFFCSRGQRDKPALLVYLLYLTCAGELSVAVRFSVA